MELVKYDAACRAIAEARAVDEVKDIRDKATALAAYGRVAKNKELELDAAEIRIRAERRLGEIMAMQRESGELARPPGSNQHKKVDRVIEKPEANPPTLADVGIDKNLADRARKLAAVASEDFERTLSEHRDEQKAVTARTFQKLEDAAPPIKTIRLMEAWTAAAEDERIAFMSEVGLQYATNTASMTMAGKVDAGIWAEFVAHREAIRKPLRKQSAVKNYEILAELTLEQQRECVDNTIRNAWQGLFPPKEGKNGKNSGFNRPRNASERIDAANQYEPDPEIDKYF